MIMTVQVGDGATYSVGSDRYPATVVAVEYFKSGARKGKARTVTVESDEYWVTSGSVQDGTAKYAFKRNTEGSLRTFNVDKEGRFGKPGHRLTVGSRNAYQDPHV